VERHYPFDTIEHLYAWTQSETRRELVKEIAPLLAEGDKTGADRTGLLVHSAGANVRKPKRWKQFLITLLVIFPSTNLVPLVTGALLPGLKGLLLHLINDACVVALVVWFWMPIVTRLFAGWLKKPDPPQRSTLCRKLPH
jgi:antibiotic biosynthesis monooxygenase (ABM) superfamily enzyme